jgi:hypothetical protein
MHKKLNLNPEGIIDNQISRTKLAVDRVSAANARKILVR